VIILPIVFLPLILKLVIIVLKVIITTWLMIAADVRRLGLYPRFYVNRNRSICGVGNSDFKGTGA
jgi:hypothetical protein